MSISSEKTGRINLLPDHVANKIAAGEVVERPASVLKELMENSLDADATQIDVEIAVGGRKLVKVSDNGKGMDRDDALLSIERFATSKIRDVDDIESVATLGFRGEALAAISAVSRFSLKTCSKNSVSGTEIIVSAGKLIDVREIGYPAGTSIEVRNLFFNIPARLKFLRTAETELAHIRHTFLLYALANNMSGMSLTADGRQIYSLAPGAGLLNRMHSLLHASEQMDLKEVSGSDKNLKITGYAALPSYSRSDRSEQFIFINGRPAGAPVIYNAVRESYHTLLPRGRFPAVFLFIEINPEMVDVNVHPAKKEVRFRNAAMVRDFIINSLTGALSSVNPQPVVRSPEAGPESGPGEQTSFRPSRQGSFPYFDMARRVPGPDNSGGTDDPKSRAGSLPEPAEASESGVPPLKPLRTLGQIGGLYVLLETSDGLVIMDPHAAHERVLFEEYMRHASGNAPVSQRLLSPETIELLSKDALILKQNIGVLVKMGFGISEFGENVFMVDAVPDCVSCADIRQVITDLLSELHNAGTRGAARLSEESVARAACKSAVKARGKLAAGEIESLIEQLMRTEMPYTCPHGRPTLIHTSFRELNRKFGRV